MNKAIVHVMLLLIITISVSISSAQKPERKLIKARKSLKEAKLDLLIADELLMVAQVDSIVELEKAQKTKVDKMSNQKQKQLLRK
jgi:ATP:corrinoid adenosyltransferase